MKKTARNILIMLAVLLVLGGAAAALLFTQPGDDGGQAGSQAPVSSAPAETVMDRDRTEVSSITVENKEGSYRMVPQDAGGEESSSTVSFQLEGYENYEVDHGQITASAGSVLSLTVVKNLGAQEDLEAFGLSGQQAVKVTVEYRDGGRDQLVLGDDAAESSGRYLLKDGTVYIVSGLSDRLYESLFTFFPLELFTVPDRTQDVEGSDGTVTQQAAADLLESARLSGTQFPSPIQIGYDSSRLGNYLITSPVTAESGTEKFELMVASLKSMTADRAVAAGLTKETLEKYGLAQPFAQIEFKLNGAEHTMAVSEEDGDGNRYLIVDDRDVVYQVSADSVSAWAEATLMDLRISYVWLPNIMNVSRLSLTVEGGTAYAFPVTRTKNEERSTEDNVIYNLFPKNAEGKDLEYENYQHLYQQLIAVSVLSQEETPYSGEPVLRAEFQYFSGGEDDVIEYYAAGNDRYAAVLNGQFNGLVRKSELDRIIALIPELDAGNTVEKRQ